MTAVFCADVGSIKEGNFGWAGYLPAQRWVEGTDIEQLCVKVSNCLEVGGRVALGFECPLFVPLPVEPRLLGSGRKGEASRPWSAGAGCAALATGLVQVCFVLDYLRRRVSNVRAFLKWSEFSGCSSGLFLWEAFVSGASKSGSHVGDARVGAQAFVNALPSPDSANAIAETRVLSLVGTALMRTGWDVPSSILEEPCLVIAG